MVDLEKLKKAILCIETPNSGTECENCPYKMLEEVKNKELPVPYDVEIDGKFYWEVCDCERIAQDAVNTINEMQKELEKKGGGIDNGYHG